MNIILTISLCLNIWFIYQMIKSQLLVKEITNGLQELGKFVQSEKKKTEELSKKLNEIYKN